MTGAAQLSGSNSVPRRRLQSTALALAIVLLPGFLAPPSAPAQTFTVLYSFTGGVDGSFPSGVIRDTAGNLYGTTLYGGHLACRPPFATGCGTVFKIDATGKKTGVHNFAGGADGASPYAGVIRDAAGNLYGTTLMGGDVACNSGIGCGTVFKLDPSGTQTVLYKFTNVPDATAPGSLTRDAKDNFYGMGDYGGLSNIGAVFKLDSSGKETVLYSFHGTTDGAFPWLGVGVVLDAAGNLYGTTWVGGSFGKGTVFKVDSAGRETVLYSFTGGADGALPHAGLVRDTQGNLFGTTQNGGAFDFGTVFKVDNTGNETVLYSFTGGTDGADPFGGLIRDSVGNLYGTTSGVSVGSATVFKLDSAGHETILHSFAAGEGSPWAGVIRDAAGNIYGTTIGGGTANLGTVFKIAP
ncbi:MAG TPA: choice-of-anchor tandem repeat GloVer-containing protein [Candidatus Acidoferrum sp.]|jgi:uncharacterized repeat protein (TIGR03803 family)|nr:choice-of-anchor tandem repeat GloVer-containing protein [Candidatus Acidoferrum sp.]